MTESLLRGIDPTILCLLCLSPIFFQAGVNPKQVEMRKLLMTTMIPTLRWDKKRTESASICIHFRTQDAPRSKDWQQKVKKVNKPQENQKES
jgi:hypothetical protein